MTINGDDELLEKKMQFTGSQAGFKSCFPVLHPCQLVTNVSSDDGRALLFIAANLIDQAITHNIVSPLLDYAAITTDGIRWRFVALQLNTLDFNNTATRKAAWVYESKLYHQEDGSYELRVNEEAFCVLYDILHAAGTSNNNSNSSSEG